MKNTIDASIEFSFKGEDYCYTSEIDLDQLLLNHDALPSLHATLARRHGIDTYSYLYEVMEDSEIEFSNPQGFAANYLINGHFDLSALASNWHENKIMLQLKSILKNEMDITDLNQHPALKRVLIETYNLGRKA